MFKRVGWFACLAVAFAALGWWLRHLGVPSLLIDRPLTSAPGSAAGGGQGRSLGEAAAERGPVALGRLEPAGKVIDVSALPGDRIESLAVEENAEVRKNDPLATLDSRSLRELEWQACRSQRLEAESRRAAEEKLADARVAAAKAALNQAGNYESDLRVEESKVAVLRQNLALAQATKRRLETLASTDLVSPQEREEQDLTVAKAQAELKAAELALEKGRQAGKLAVAAAEADLEAALAAKRQTLSTIAVESLKKREELAHAQWDRAILRSPIDGTVLKIFLRPGEAVGPTPVLQIADRRQMVAIAEVYEADVKRIRLGQEARIRSRAFPSPYDETGLRGTVSRIGKTIARPELKSLDPLAQADRHVIEVRVNLDPEGSKVAGEFIHLQVEVQFAPIGP
jgi:HlyD family secretion protein